MGFFDSYPEYYQSGVNPYPNRLNERYNALIKNNKKIISGKRILDLASDNGRWSFAAIKNGASKVIGIEFLLKSVKTANNLMTIYNVSKEKFQFIEGKIHKIIKQIEPNSIDTVFCFGYLYHTMYHMNLFSKIKNLNPKHIIIDTNISKNDAPVIEIRPKKRIISEHKIEGYPSKSGLEAMLNEFGFHNFQYYDWPSKNLEDWKNLGDYKNRKRITFVAEGKKD